MTCGFMSKGAIDFLARQAGFQVDLEWMME